MRLGMTTARRQRAATLFKRENFADDLGLRAALRHPSRFTAMNEQDIKRLVDEIECADFREFWWESELLELASQVRDIRLVRALALRHHGLSNKEAFSAHVLRNAIKTIDAPTFPFSWAIIDAENDTNRLVRSLDDFSYAPWALAYILGEVGGHDGPLTRGADDRSGGVAQGLHGQRARLADADRDLRRAGARRNDECLARLAFEADGGERRAVEAE